MSNLTPSHFNLKMLPLVLSLHAIVKSLYLSCKPPFYTERPQCICKHTVSEGFLQNVLKKKID